MVEVFPIIPLLITTSLVMLTLAIFAWRKRFTGNAAIFLSLSMLAVALYCFGFAMELASDTLPAVMLWVRFQHLGIFLIAPTWLLFAISVSGYRKRIDFKLILALSVIPIYIFFTAQTLGWLNLAHHNPRMATVGPYQILAYDRNTFNYISIGYYTLCLGISTILFAMMFFRAAPSARKHVSLYLIGSLPPWGTAILYNLNLDSSGLDLTPLLLGVSGLFFTFGFLKFRMLDLIPLARNTIFDKMATGVLIVDAEDQIVDFNPAFKEIFPQVNSGNAVGTLFGPYPELMGWFKEGVDERVDFHKSEGNNSTHYRVSLSEIDDRKARVIGKIFSFFENTQEKLLLEKLEEMATHDGLTKIFNRQHFDLLAKNEINRLKRYAGDLSMIMIDLDNFKLVNDTYGHGAGDEVLKKVAHTLLCQLRQTDSLARYGGEEFVILLPKTDLPSAQQLCERLQQSLSAQIVNYEAHQIRLNASFGLATIQDGPNLSLETVYKLADTALYAAKTSGGNTVCVCEAVDDLTTFRV